jgi:hypothetical protein
MAINKKSFASQESEGIAVNPCSDDGQFCCYSLVESGI